MMSASVPNKPVRTEKVYNKGYAVQKLTKEVDVVINGKCVNINVNTVYKGKTEFV